MHASVMYYTTNKEWVENILKDNEDTFKYNIPDDDDLLIELEYNGTDYCISDKYNKEDHGDGPYSVVKRNLETLPDDTCEFTRLPGEVGFIKLTFFKDGFEKYRQRMIQENIIEVDLLSKILKKRGDLLSKRLADVPAFVIDEMVEEGLLNKYDKPTHFKAMRKRFEEHNGPVFVSIDGDSYMLVNLLSDIIWEISVNGFNDSDTYDIYIYTDIVGDHHW